MKIPISIELADVYTDLIGCQNSIDYENLRPSDITRYILNIFDDKELTVGVVYHLISNLHDHFSTVDYDKISEISGFNIRHELKETKELFKMKEEKILEVEVRA